jgi:hypothetical protein
MCTETGSDVTPVKGTGLCHFVFALEGAFLRGLQSEWNSTADFVQGTISVAGLTMSDTNFYLVAVCGFFRLFREAGA